MARHPPRTTGAAPSTRLPRPPARGSGDSAAPSERGAAGTPPRRGGPRGGGGHSPAPGAALTALLAGRGAALAAVRAQEVAGQLQVLEVGEGDEGAGHAPGAAGAAATQPGNARPLPSGPARPCARRMRRSRATEGGGARGAVLREGGRDGGSAECTARLGRLFQCSVALSVKKFLPTSNLSVPWCSLRPFTLVLSLAAWEKRPSPTFPRAPLTCREL